MLQFHLTKKIEDVNIEIDHNRSVGSWCACTPFRINMDITSNIKTNAFVIEYKYYLYISRNNRLYMHHNKKVSLDALYFRAGELDCQQKQSLLILVHNANKYLFVISHITIKYFSSLPFTS